MKKTFIYWSIPMFLLFLTIFNSGAANAADVLRETLKNGLQVVIVRNTLAPVVTTMVNYKVGSVEAPDGFPGTAHALEHMMFRGSPGLSAGQLANIMAAMGGRFDADTQQAVTQYYFTVPAEDLDVALHIESIRMQDVLDTEDLWAQERGAIEQEVAQDLSNPMYVFYSDLLSRMFAGTPYAHDALGTRPSFNKTTGAMLKKFHEDWYAPNNAVIVIVGDVDPRKAIATVRELFGGISRRPAPERPKIDLQPLKPATIEVDTDLPYGVAVVAYRLPGYKSKDFAAGQILADILNSQRADLYGLVPAGRALMAGFESMILPDSGLGYAMAAYPHGGDGRKMAGTVKSIISDYLKNGFPKELVDASKRLEIADAEFQKNSVEGLADIWSEALAVAGLNSPDEMTEAIKKVTVDDVDRVAREYLVNDTAVVGILSSQPAGKASISNVSRGKESFAPSQTRQVKLPAWAEKAVRPPDVPKSTIQPSVMNLPNGLRLIVQPEKISKTISLYGKVKSNPDLQAPEGKEGVDQVLESLFEYGTTSLDRLTFQKAVDDIAANLSAGSSFSLQVLTEYFDRGVDLLADNMLNPALPEKAFGIVRQETADSVAGQIQSPSYLAKRALLKGLYPASDPKLREATPKTVAGLSLDDVREYYKNVFRPDLTTIVVIGDVTPEKAKAAVEKYFGGWKATGNKPLTDLPPVPLNKPASAAVPDSSRVQDMVLLAENLDITRSDPAYYTLNVGNHVLSGAFYATRLYHDLREKAGLVYTVESFLSAKKHRAVFEIMYACDPPNVGRAKAMVQENLARMQKNPVTPEELNQAKTLLMRQIPLSESSVDSIGDKLLGLSMEGLPLDEPILAARRYKETTASEVQEAFKKWIRPSGLVVVTLGPEPN